jgi:transcriptional regulator with XRE-family HTH domain
MTVGQLESAIREAEPVSYVPGDAERKRLRQAAGVSAATAAIACGVTPLTWLQWERGVWTPRKGEHMETYRRALSVFAQWGARTDAHAA